MGFRDDTDALRARAGALETELDDAQERVAELEADHEEVEPLKERVAELERELGHKRARKRAGVLVALPRLVFGLLIAVVVAGGAIGFGLMSELSVFETIELEGTPARGMVDLAEHPFPPGLRAAISTEHAVEEVVPGCRGYVPSDPLLVLRATEPRRVRLWAASDTDLVLFVHTESGAAFCDDDSGGGTNPMLEIELPAGDHRVWVGTYQSGTHADFEMSVDARRDEETELVLQGEASLETIVASGEELDRQLEGVTRGEVRGDQAGDGCVGYLPTQPTAFLDVSVASDARITARSPTDLVLAVRHPDGTFACDDDAAGGTDSRLSRSLAIGRHMIWVGTYAPYASANFALEIEAAPAETDSDD